MEGSVADECEHQDQHLVNLPPVATRVLELAIVRLSQRNSIACVWFSTDSTFTDSVGRQRRPSGAAGLIDSSDIQSMSSSMLGNTHKQ